MFYSNKIGPNTKFNPQEKNIYTSLKFFLCLTKLLGLLPLENISKGKEKLQFKWCNLGSIYSYFFIMCLTGSTIFCGVSGFENGFTIPTVANSVLFGGSLMVSILYIRLALEFPMLIRKWCYVDDIFNKRYGYPKGIDKKIRFFTIIYFILAIGDHAIGISNRYFGLVQDFKENYTASMYYNKTFSDLFRYVKFSTGLGIYTSLITTRANLTWAFNDLFIIVMSILLASRFLQISNKISKEHDQPNTLFYWREIRQDYDKLCELCVYLNDTISMILMTSYFQNLTFILIQLYYSLRMFDNQLEKGYFMFSSGYILFKTGTVSLYAASINDESKSPAIYLNNVPSKYYNIEIKRLLIQISFDDVVLSGCKMFKITRGLLLSIASAIVAYELLLLQLSSMFLKEDKVE